ncbi:CopG family antitoxin [soil metagenome]
MKDYDLDKEEQELLDAFEAGELVSVSNLKAEKMRLQKTAKNTLNKTRNINIRLSERDLYKLKAKAIEEGIPYQTLASSILHKSAAK